MNTPSWRTQRAYQLKLISGRMWKAHIVPRQQIMTYNEISDKKFFLVGRREKSWKSSPVFVIITICESIDIKILLFLARYESI